MKPSDHYRYDWHRDPTRSARSLWTVTAVINEGHKGTLLNCPHSDCAELRKERIPMPPPPVRRY